MKICEYGVYPHHTEYAGADYYNNGGGEALADAAAGCNGAIHESAYGIGEAHDLRALKAGLDDGFIVCKQE